MSEINPQSEDMLTIRGQDDVHAAWNNAKKALDAIWHKNVSSKPHEDFASILVFLSNKGLFDEVLAEVDKDVEKKMTEILESEVKTRETGSDQNFKEKNRLTGVFHQLFSDYGSPGFPKAQNVVLVGSSGAVFGAIISNGLLFKDGTGPGHGEHTHTIQWLVLAKAKKTGRLSTKKSTIFELYCETAGKGTAASPGLYWFAENKEYVQMGPPGTTYWNYLVDCFEEARGQKENALTNILSNSYRSPGHLSNKLRDSKTLFLSRWLQQRAQKRPFDSAKGMRDYHITKQLKKPEMLYNKNTDVSANLFIPKNAPKKFIDIVQERVEGKGGLKET